MKKKTEDIPDRWVDDDGVEHFKQRMAKPVINEHGDTVKVDADDDNSTVDCNIGNINKDVVGIFTTPRLLFADNMFCAQNALYNLGIMVNWAQGVFWGQVMTRLFEDCIRKGYKYAVTLDYDSVFSVDDIRELYAIMETRPDISALCPLQLRRGDGAPLTSITDAEGREALVVNRKVLELTTVPMATGHFGLTFFRLADVARMPKPWFNSIPDQDGRWEDGKTDEDIMFWNQMRKAGLNVCLAPNIHIGHMELTVTWADKRLNPVFQPINEYQTKGKPDWSFGQRMIQVVSPNALEELERI